MSTPPLQGFTVVEAASYVSGPLAGMVLADLGADVVKVEPPGGDPFRRFGGGEPSAPWVSCNRGKRSVVADLKTPAGVERLLALADGADVFLSNWRPEVADRLGIGDVTLAARNPRLVRCWISGWGTSGPKASETAFDVVVQAEGGMIDASSRDGRLDPVPGWPVDKATAMVGVQSILAALLVRERTGAGERLDLAMLDVTAYVDFPDLLTSRVFVDEQPGDARSTSATAVRSLPASDGAIVLSTVSGSQIKGACVALGHPEWAGELFRAGPPAQMMAAMHRLFSPVTATQPVRELLRRFAEHHVPAGACASLDEHLADEQVAHNEIYDIEDWPAIGRVRTVRYPTVAQGWGRLAAGPAPVELPAEG